MFVFLKKKKKPKEVFYYSKLEQWGIERESILFFVQN